MSMNEVRSQSHSERNLFQNGSERQLRIPLVLNISFLISADFVAVRKFHNATTHGNEGTPRASFKPPPPSASLIAIGRIKIPQINDFQERLLCGKNLLRNHQFS